MHITLRPGEKLYLNGAVLRSDRKVCLELMNDAVFLLEAHVMSVEKATSPLRQLYFIVQMMLMNPGDVGAAAQVFNETVGRMSSAYDDGLVLAALNKTQQLVATSRCFEALKVLRGVFNRDDALLGTDRLALAS